MLELEITSLFKIKVKKGMNFFPYMPMNTIDIQQAMGRAYRPKTITPKIIDISEKEEI